jgi:hypothetical protein
VSRRCQRILWISYRDRKIGFGAYGPAPAIRMRMSGKFFLLFGIFSLKTENHLLGKKISQKILRRAFLICYFLGCAASILKKAG